MHENPSGGSSAVEQRTVKCGLSYAVILWSGVQTSLPGLSFCTSLQQFHVSVLSKIIFASVHSTRVVFIPSKDKIRVRVPMDAIGLEVRSNGSIQLP